VTPREVALLSLAVLSCPGLHPFRTLLPLIPAFIPHPGSSFDWCFILPRCPRLAWLDGGSLVDLLQMAPAPTFSLQVLLLVLASVATMPSGFSVCPSVCSASVSFQALAVPVLLLCAQLLCPVCNQVDQGCPGVHCGAGRSPLSDPTTSSRQARHTFQLSSRLQL